MCIHCDIAAWTYPRAPSIIETARRRTAAGVCANTTAIDCNISLLVHDRQRTAFWGRRKDSSQRCEPGGGFSREERLSGSPRIHKKHHNGSQNSHYEETHSEPIARGYLHQSLRERYLDN